MQQAQAEVLGLPAGQGMKLLFLVKREPQQRDLVLRPYGRFHHLPRELAAMGHEVTVVMIGHRGLPGIDQIRDGVRAVALDVRSPGPLAMLRSVDSLARDISPDWVIGASDAQYGWLASRASRACGARFAVDAYDNFEAYMPWNLPLHWTWRRAVANADLVTAAGPQLAARLQAHRGREPGAAVVPMAADPEFTPRDRASCRSAVGLPLDSPLVGHIGSWSRSRHSALLLDAFREARQTRPDLQLVLSGRHPPQVAGEPGVIALGYLADAQVPLLIPALDVACIVTADTAFGRYSYPAKLCEAMACEVPVVATDVAPVRWMLDGRAIHLANPGDPRGFAQRIVAQLGTGRATFGPRMTWREVAATFESLLLK